MDRRSVVKPLAGVLVFAMLVGVPSGFAETSKPSFWEQLMERFNPKKEAAETEMSDSDDEKGVSKLAIGVAKRGAAKAPDTVHEGRKAALERAMIAREAQKAKFEGRDAFGNVKEHQKREKKKQEKIMEERKQTWAEKQVAFLAARRASKKAREEQALKKRTEKRQKKMSGGRK